MEMSTHIITLQRFSTNEDKLLRCLGPRRKKDIIDDLMGILLVAERITRVIIP